CHSPPREGLPRAVPPARPPRGQRFPGPRFPAQGRLFPPPPAFFRQAQKLPALRLPACSFVPPAQPKRSFPKRPPVRPPVLRFRSVPPVRQRFPAHPAPGQPAEAPPPGQPPAGSFFCGGAFCSCPARTQPLSFLLAYCTPLSRVSPNSTAGPGPPVHV